VEAASASYVDEAVARIVAAAAAEATVANGCAAVWRRSQRSRPRHDAALSV